MKKKRSFFAGAITLLLIVAMATTALAVSGQMHFNFANIALDSKQKIATGTTIAAPNAKLELTEAQEIHIPTLSDVGELGYPLNENGETYGPICKNTPTSVNETSNTPDLQLVENENGLVGYIRQSEVPGATVNSLEEAFAYTPQECYINMYLHDGTTVIGEFFISNGSV